MGKGKTKVFHLEMEGQHYYFGSPKAMFDIMGEEAMGMKYSSYHSNIILKVGDVYKNRRHGYIIRLGELGQAKTNRGAGMEARINKRIEAALMAHGINGEQTVAEAAAPATATPTEAPIVGTPAAETQAPVAETTTKKTRKKKGDVPEQLTLF